MGAVLLMLHASAAVSPSSSFGIWRLARRRDTRKEPLTTEEQLQRSINSAVTATEQQPPEKEASQFGPVYQFRKAVRRGIRERYLSLHRQHRFLYYNHMGLDQEPYPI